MADPYKPRAPFAPWDRRQLPGTFDVEETARRVGNYKWAEMKLFEALGGWVATVPELDVKMRLGTHCYHHALHRGVHVPPQQHQRDHRCTHHPLAELRVA